MDEHLKNACEEVVRNEFPRFFQMLEQNLDFHRWGFTMLFSGVGQHSPIVVYASDSCRVKFAWELADLRDGKVIIHVYYGRSHAPVDDEVIDWNGQKCWCWHNVEKSLYFLDGVSPSEAVKNKFGSPHIWQQFQESSVGNGWNQPEYMAKMHATIWKYYGQRLFDLFDLRLPSLWEQYCGFVAEYQRLRQEFSLSGYPSPDKIC